LERYVTNELFVIGDTCFGLSIFVAFALKHLIIILHS
jgi:hypothetical protein